MRDKPSQESSMSVLTRRAMSFAAAVLGAAVLTAGAMIASVAEGSSPAGVVHHQSWALEITDR
jgi:hypothetical protein